ncbi:OLC1v1003402C1 [Oldenlandia corymbosa var. corymbosa]|uniref:OLC1v1003402C1 n=1 Tax=Oldenlandia corymbosa var. corymbosa TaxID=529605 RepID=A0AAV1D9Z4_OLDCO|nr:OLC1v1003402C1 [Oldenlandia corymbosa var. corymbosa]
MGIRLLSKIPQSKLISKLKSGMLSSLTGAEIPKGHMAVYVGGDAYQKKRYVVPVFILESSFIPGPFEEGRGRIWV